MSLKDEGGIARRRRGAELEHALLEAAWHELQEKGYAALTMESVAERASTSRAVIYRRWPTKPDLVRAALERAGQRQPVVVPDTGSLREDVVELLRRANRTRAWLGIMMTLQLSGYYLETGSSMSELRSAFIGDRGSVLDEILARAVERGEADPAKLTPRVVAVPFDLYRQELMMTLKPVPDEVSASIVDEVFLPLVRPAS